MSEASTVTNDDIPTLEEKMRNYLAKIHPTAVIAPGADRAAAFHRGGEERGPGAQERVQDRVTGIGQRREPARRR